MRPETCRKKKVSGMFMSDETPMRDVAHSELHGRCNELLLRQGRLAERIASLESDRLRADARLAELEDWQAGEQACQQAAARVSDPCPACRGKGYRLQVATASGDCSKEPCSACDGSGEKA